MATLHPRPLLALFPPALLNVQNVEGDTYAARIQSPPNLNIAPSNPYWLFILADCVPTRDTQAFSVTAPDASFSGTYPPSRCLLQVDRMYLHSSKCFGGSTVLWLLSVLRLAFNFVFRLFQ